MERSRDFSIRRFYARRRAVDFKVLVDDIADYLMKNRGMLLASVEDAASAADADRAVASSKIQQEFNISLHTASVIYDIYTQSFTAEQQSLDYIRWWLHREISGQIYGRYTQFITNLDSSVIAYILYKTLHWFYNNQPEGTAEFPVFRWILESLLLSDPKQFVKNPPEFEEATEHREAFAWYINYPGNSYALGPYRFETLTDAAKVADIAKEQFGSYPTEIYPDGRVEEVPEYIFPIQPSINLNRNADEVTNELAIAYEVEDIEDIDIDHMESIDIASLCLALMIRNHFAGDFVADAIESLLDLYPEEFNAAERWTEEVQSVWLPVAFDERTVIQDRH